MIVSGRELAKFVIFAVVLAALVLFIAANRGHFLGKPASGDSTAPAGEDLTGAEAISTAALAGGGSLVPDGAEATAGLIGTSPGSDFFVEYRLEREKSRSEQLDLLRELLDRGNLDQASRDKALAAWLEITESIAKEVDIENLIRAKGFEDVVAILVEGKATIMVRSAGLTPEQALTVADIATRISGLGFEDVVVMAKDG